MAKEQRSNELEYANVNTEKSAYMEGGLCAKKREEVGDQKHLEVGDQKQLEVGDQREEIGDQKHLRDRRPKGRGR